MPRLRKSRLAERLLQHLKGGGHNSLGRANAAAAAAASDRKKFRELILAIWSSEPVIRMRAADAAEKASRTNPSLLEPFKAELLGLLRSEQQQEVRWHLAMMIPRLLLTSRERIAAAAIFREYLSDRSSIVRTCALQALYDLSRQEPALHEETELLLRTSLQSGTAAMKARARKLLNSSAGLKPLMVR